MELLNILKSFRLDLSTEKNAQSSLAWHLQKERLAYSREHHLSEEDIPDFMIGKVCVELKTKGSATSIFRQLSRYAEHDCVSEIILITNKSIGLPPKINGKPAFVINMGAAWL